MIIAFYTFLEQHHERRQLPSWNFSFHFSPTVTIPPTELLSSAGSHLFPQNPCWDCSTGFSLWQVHCLPSSRVEWDNYALPAVCGDSTTLISAGGRELAQLRERMAEKHLQRKQTEATGFSFTCHLPICEWGRGMRMHRNLVNISLKESDIPRNYLRLCVRS